jgi:hypothetical protein
MNFNYWLIGDSSGPLNQDNKLIEVVSFGSTNCLDPNFPNVYTRVYNYIIFHGLILISNLNLIHGINCIKSVLKWISFID